MNHEGDTYYFWVNMRYKSFCNISQLEGTKYKYFFLHWSLITRDKKYLNLKHVTHFLLHFILPNGSTRISKYSSDAANTDDDVEIIDKININVILLLLLLLLFVLVYLLFADDATPDAGVTTVLGVVVIRLLFV